MSDTKKLSFNDLLPGDVLVMHADRAKSISHLDMHQLETELILLLTDSDVSHGAIYYGGDTDHFLIDDGRKGVGKHLLTVAGENPAKWYVRRLKTESNLRPVLARADYYNTQKTAYDWELLILIALLLVFKKVTPDTAYYQSILLFLKKVVVTLDQVTHNPDTDYFICSQFVATCYAQAGENYQLNVKNGSLQSSLKTDETSLIELFTESEHSKNTSISNERETSVTEQPDLVDLHIAISKHQRLTDHQAPDESLKSSLNSTLMELFQHFLRLHQHTFNLQTEDFNNPEKVRSVINKLSVDFVTPADLKSNCTNLEDIGVIELVYH